MKREEGRGLGERREGGEERGGKGERREKGRGRGERREGGEEGRGEENGEEG